MPAWLQRARQHLRDTLGGLENQEQTTRKRIDKKRESKSGVNLSEKKANKRMNGMKSWRFDKIDKTRKPLGYTERGKRGGGREKFERKGGREV